LNLNYLIEINIVILICYCIYIVVRRKINPQYGLDKQNLNFVKLSVGIFAILIVHFLVALIFIIITPEEVIKINQVLGLVDFILLLIYMELIEYLLRNGKMTWFLKRSSN
jgi:hypothetical protein